LASERVKHFRSGEGLLASTSLSLQLLNIGIAFLFVSTPSVKANRQIFAHGADLLLVSDGNSILFSHV
jgi:hypothetical protein